MIISRWITDDDHSTDVSLGYPIGRVVKHIQRCAYVCFFSLLP